MFDNQTLILLAFVAGYLLLIFEHLIKVNKAAISLLTGVLCWGLYLHGGAGTIELKMEALGVHLADIGQILFFLLGAMTIVEVLASYQCFGLVRDYLTISSPKKLYWVVMIIGFWMSSVLDNLTTLIVLVTLLKQVVSNSQLRKVLCAGLVFAVNVGGAWTPIGDITTTMLWIEGRVNTIPLVQHLLIPSLLSFFAFAFLYSFAIPRKEIVKNADFIHEPCVGTKRILWLGVLGLVMVPVLKVVFHLPPFMGMITSLSVLWVVTDRIQREDGKGLRPELKVERILQKVDTSTILFFLGILLAVDALETSGILDSVAVWSQNVMPNPYFFTLSVGLFSAIVDNVPLVAGMIKMYDPSAMPADHIFWHLTAYAAGVGGSVLIIGSAAGVALMSMVNISFGWYLRKVSGPALLAFLLGWGSIYFLNVVIA